MNNPALIERRKEERIVPKDNTMFLKLTFPYPIGQELVKPINDISPSGLSFNVAVKEGYLPAEVPLKNITIKGPQYEKVISNSIVRSCTHIENANLVFNRIGIEFLLKPFEKSSLRRRLLNSYKLRMPRYNCNFISLLNWEISFNYKEQHITTKNILNFSKFGIAFCIEQTNLILKGSDVIRDLKIQIDGETMHEGECTIVNLQNNTNSLVVRCSLRKSIDLERIFILAGRSQTAKDIEEFLPELNKFKDVEPEFKADVADLRNFLESLESRLNFEDQKINNTKIKEENIIYYKEKILDSIFGPASERLDEFFNKLRISVSNLDQSKYNLYKHCFRESVKHFFLKSPFVDRSYHKPLGYAGDYKVMNMIYREPYAGEGLFAKLINKYAWQQTAAKAVRNRVPYITNKLGNLLNSPPNENKRYLKVLTIGCGPAVEIQEIIKQNKYADKFIFTLVDGDNEALLYSQDKLVSLIKESGRKIQINFVNRTIDQIIKDRGLITGLGRQDLIYSIGLFDYLTLKVITKAIERLYELLSNDGKLLIGNFNHLNDTKTYMEYVHDWYLFHRSEKEMLKFIEKIPNPKNFYFETESTKTTNFLIIEK